MVGNFIAQQKKYDNCILICFVAFNFLKFTKLYKINRFLICQYKYPYKLLPNKHTYFIATIGLS